MSEKGHERLKRHLVIMEELQTEWEENKAFHVAQRDANSFGFRSSQISAMVMYLLKKGVIK